MSGTGKYGNFYWGIKTPLSPSGDIYAMADEAKVLPDGALVLLNLKGEKPLINIAFAPGQWTTVFAASLIDGHAVAVEYWKGEVKR